MKIGVNSLLDLSQSVCVCKSDISTLPKRQSGVLDPPISNLKESTILSLHSEETICSVSVLDSHYGYGPFSRYGTVAHSICMVQHIPSIHVCLLVSELYFEYYRNSGNTILGPPVPAIVRILLGWESCGVPSTESLLVHQ